MIEITLILTWTDVLHKLAERRQASAWQDFTKFHKSLDPLYLSNGLSRGTIEYLFILCLQAVGVMGRRGGVFSLSKVEITCQSRYEVYQ